MSDQHRCRLLDPAGTARLGILALLLCAACREPAPSSPFLAARVELDTPARGGQSLLASAAQDVDVPVFGPAPGDQAAPVAIFNGTHYFVVWSSTLGTASCQVLGVHVSPAGQVLDDTQVVLTDDCPASLAVGFDGQSYLVLWTRWSWTSSQEDIYGARVGVDGALLEGEKVISRASSRQNFVAVVWGQSSYLMVWENIAGERRPGALAYSRVAADGTLIDPDPIGIPRSGATYEQRPAVAFDGTHFLVAWSMNGIDRALGARIDQDGQLLGGDAFALDACTAPLGETCSSRLQPSLAFGAQRFLVAWANGISGRIEASLVDSSGAFVGSVNTFSSAARSGHSPRAAFDGTNFWIVWTSVDGGVSSTLATRVTPEGVALDAEGGSGNLTVVAASAEGQAPALAASPGQALVTWVDERGPLATDIFGARLDGDGVRQDGSAEDGGFVVSRSWNTQLNPAVASDGDGYLIAWADARDANTWDIYAVHVDAQGQVLDSPPLHLGTGASGSIAPAVAYSEGQYLVAWQDLGVTGPLQIGTTGVLLAASGDVTEVQHLFGTLCSGLVAAPSEGGFRLRCVRGNSLQSYILRYGLVRTDGSVQDLAESIIDDSQFQAMGVAYQGTTHVVTRYELSGATFRYYRASAELVGPTGNRLWSGSLPSDGSNYTFAPVASARPEGFLLVSALSSAFVSLSGTVVHASAPLRGFDGQQALPVFRAPAMAFDGTGHLLVWPSSGAASAEIQALRLSDDGMVSGAGADNRGTVLSAEPGRESAPRLAANQHGQLLLAYQLTSGVSSVERVRFRLLDPAPLGAGCLADLDCVSDHCVDGVCCDGACGGGATDDCQACSMAAGAQVDGTCAVISQGHVCRPVAGGCDLEERCDGVVLDCPADLFAAASSTCTHGLGACDTGGACNGSDGLCHSTGVQAAGVECRALAGPCDHAEQCDGVSGACPQDYVVWAGMECRPSSGGCDPAEACDGVNPGCPADVLFEAGHVCRQASGECDLAETCAGGVAECPPDLHVDEGQPCSDGLCDAWTCDRSPHFTSQPATSARCNEAYAYSTAGAPVVSGEPPITFILAQGPAGMSADSATGALTWTPTPSQVGSHAVTLRASNAFGEGQQDFAIQVSCGSSDGGAGDGGSGSDGGAVSADSGGSHSGSGHDAGSTDAADAGCSCQGSAPGARGVLLLGLLLRLARRRR